MDEEIEEEREVDEEMEDQPLKGRWAHRQTYLWICDPSTLNGPSRCL